MAWVMRDEDDDSDQLSDQQEAQFGTDPLNRTPTPTGLRRARRGMDSGRRRNAACQPFLRPPWLSGLLLVGLNTVEHVAIAMFRARSVRSSCCEVLTAAAARRMSPTDRRLSVAEACSERSRPTGHDSPHERALKESCAWEAWAEGYSKAVDGVPSGRYWRRHRGPGGHPIRNGSCRWTGDERQRRPNRTSDTLGSASRSGRLVERGPDRDSCGIGWLRSGCCHCRRARCSSRRDRVVLV